MKVDNVLTELAYETHPKNDPPDLSKVRNAHQLAIKQSMKKSSTAIILGTLSLSHYLLKLRAYDWTEEDEDNLLKLRDQPGAGAVLCKPRFC